MRPIKDKKTLITGAASGIGRETALQMAAAGARIIALDQNAEGLSQLAEEIKSQGGLCHLLTCDLSKENEIGQAAHQALQLYGGVDILINNAGVGFHGATHDMTPEQRNRILQVNLNAPFALFQHLVHSLVNSDVGGHLVNISSIFGLVPYQRTAAYCASKYGLVGMTEAIRAEYGRWGLGVTLVCPGFVDTPLLHKLPEESKNGEKLRKPSRWLTTTPQKLAGKIIRGIQKNKRLVLATPMAHFLYHAKRICPGTFDFVQSFKSSKLKQLFKSRNKPNSKSESKRKAA